MSLQERLQAVLGGEEFTEVVTIPAEDQAIVLADGEIAVAETTVAEHEKEITEIQHDINTIEERLEDIEENVSGLEAMMSGEAEWNPALALKMYNDARKLTERTFGPSEKTPVIDGVESFADVSTAKLAMVDGLEEIENKKTGIGTAIINFFKNLYKSVIAAFVGLFDRLKGIEKRADALKGRLDTLTQEKLKNNIKLGEWNAYLDIDKDKNSVINKMTDVNKGVEKISNAFSGTSADKMFSTAMESINTISRILSLKTSKDDNNGTVTSGLIGGVIFKISFPKVLARFRSFSISYKNAGKSRTEGEYLDIVRLEDLKRIIEKTKELAIKARNNKVNPTSLASARDRAINAIKNTSSDENSNEKISQIRGLHMLCTQMAKTLTRYEGDVLLAAQKYVAAHF